VIFNVLFLNFWSVPSIFSSNPFAPVPRRPGFRRLSAWIGQGQH